MKKTYSSIWKIILIELGLTFAFVLFFKIRYSISLELLLMIFCLITSAHVPVIWMILKNIKSKLDVRAYSIIIEDEILSLQTQWNFKRKPNNILFIVERENVSIKGFCADDYQDYKTLYLKVGAKLIEVNEYMFDEYDELNKALSHWKNNTL